MINTLTCIELKSLLSEVTISYLEYANVIAKPNSTLSAIESAYSEAYAAKQRMLTHINSLEGSDDE